MRYVAGRPRRSSSVRCFGMVRNGSLQGRPAGRLALSRDGTVWYGMTRRECAAMRRFGGSKPISPGPARRYSSVECDGMRRFATPSPMARPGRVARYGAPVALCRALSRAGGSLGCSAMFRLTGSRGPGRLSSGTAAGSAVSSSHCLRSEGIFSREPGRVPGAGARIRAGKGSVTAPGVPLTAAYCPGRCTGGAG